MPSPQTLAHKLAAVKRVQLLMTNQNKSVRAACKEAGVPMTSFQKWSLKHSRAGEQGLMPNYASCGRKAKFHLSAEEQKLLRGDVLILDSQTLAMESFAQRPECSAETRALILEEMDRAITGKRYCRWPKAVRSLIASTLDEKAQLRGPKHFQAISFSPRKGLFFVDEQGREIDLRPHTCWVMDDMSDNVPCLGSDEQTLSRQRFFNMDTCTDSWLGLEIIGRERDAYRGEDIVRFILRNIEAHQTMPQYLILERGAWESSFVHGLHLGKSWEQGGISTKFEGKYWGGLDALFGIVHGYSSRHKANLESSFNLLQSIVAHTGPDIGRTRGEFERATKLYLAVQAGSKDARACGFPTMEQRRETLWAACQMMNGRGRKRAATGTVEIPDDLISMFDDAERRPLPATERWRFLPIKRRATVRGGHVELSVTHYARQSFKFQINGTDQGLFLPSGFTVLVAFDPAMPALGAHVCNGETTTLNREGWGLGEFIMTAPHAADVPQFDLRGGGYAGSSKQRANAAARTSFAGVNPLKRRGMIETLRHDGQGNANIARLGGPAPVAAEHGARSMERGATSDPLLPAPRPLPVMDLAALEAAAEEHLSIL